MNTRLLLSNVLSGTLLLATAAPAQEGFFERWQERATETQDAQPHWVTPVVTVTPRLEQELRSDYSWHPATDGNTVTNLGGGKGLELIPSRNSELIIGVPPYLAHHDPAQKDTEGYVRFFSVDWQKKQVEFNPGIVLPLRPFPGTLAIGPDPNEPKEKAGPPIHDAKGRTSTLRPWKNGSNMDVNELQQGSTVYLPVFQKGALIWTGDSHCLQGNGEVNLSALECSYKEIELQPIVHKGVKTEWPWAETATDYIFMGFDEDLNEAMKIAVRNTVDWLSRQKIVPMSRDEGYMLASMAADCRVTQVVDIRKGVHCMISKSTFTQGSRTQEAIGLTSDKPGAR